MRKRLLPVCLAVLLSGCGLISAPVEMIEERLSRNDDVYYRYGMGIDLVNVGDSRQTVHEVWGVPRNTHPTYRDFDVYLGIRNGRGNWRVLPGEYNELQRTTPLIVQVSYIDDHVNAIFLFDQDAFGNSRFWCDDSNICAELFPYHSKTGDELPRNPLIVSIREKGFDENTPKPVGECELVVYVSDATAWSRTLNFVELRNGEQSLSLLSAGTYSVSRHPPGKVPLSVWPNFQYSGEVVYEARDSWQNFMDVNCEAGERMFVGVAPAKTGFWTIDHGLVVNEQDAETAVGLLKFKRAIVTSTGSASSAGTPSPAGTARLSP